MSESVRTTMGALTVDCDGSIKTGPFGTVLKAHEYSESGVPIISVGEVGYGRLRIRESTPRAPIGVVERLPDYVLAHGDIVFGRKGAVDRSAWVDKSQAGWFLGSDGIRVRLPKSVDSRFVAYQLQTSQLRDWLLQHASGSTMLSLNQRILERVPLLIPPYWEQRAIAEVLGALDNKIAANARRVETLTALVKSSFHSIVGATSESMPLGELVSVTKGVSYRSVDLVPSETSLVTLKSIDRNGNYSTRGLKPYAGPFKTQQVIEPGELVVAQTDLTQAAEVVGRVVRVPTASESRRLVASLDLSIVRAAAGCSQEFVLGIMLADRFREHCRSRTSGTTVLHLAAGAIASYSAPKVTAERRDKYAEVVRPMLELRDVTDRESELLGQMRDVLLPQLMSGKIRVKDAEDRVGEVL